MTRIVTRTGQALIDVAVLSLAYWLAFMIRFDGVPPLQMFKRLAFTWPYVVAFQFAVLAMYSVPRFAWRYVGLRETVRILEALGAAAAVLLGLRFIAGQIDFPYAQYAHIPAGVVVLNFALAFLGVTGVRVLRRMLVERTEAASRRTSQIPQTATMLVGAGQAGVLVAKEIIARPDIGIVALGFVDDDRMKQGTVIHGIPVLGTTDDLERLCAERGAKQVLITMAAAPGSVVRKIRGIAERANLRAKIIPGLYEIMDGRVNLSRIRNVAIEDLLGREPVELDSEGIAALLRDATVVVTGAGGSIGSELCRQICVFDPGRLILIERAENNLYDIHRELRDRFPDLDLVPVIADICDEERIEQVFAEHRPFAVFHAAAHKHVPMMEWNAGEAVKNNVFGTRTLADAAHRHETSIFVQISTDKAVRPTSVMGATKRVAEMYLQSLSTRSRTRFVAVRFGNVLGSTGSVVPLFREQIARGGPVTVTDPEMRRYFMMIPEACQLVLQAGALAHGGEIFLLDMGEPIKILDLARDMIRLSGYEPEKDIQITFTGIRPGEKLYEELLLDDESHDRTVHPKILVGRIPAVGADHMERAFARLDRASRGSVEDVRRALGEIVPESRLGAVSAPPPAVVPVESPSAEPRLQPAT